MTRNRIIPLITVLLLFVVPSSAASETDLLLQFRDSLTDKSPLTAWNNSIPPCYDSTSNWDWVGCDKGSVYRLDLHGLGLKGVIDVDALAELPNLRALSLMQNNFEGPLPNLTKIEGLKFLYLSENQFSGEIPSNTFITMLGLKKLHMADNHFSGGIPQSLIQLPKLMELMLQNNRFEGEIPWFPEGRILDLNVSNNALYGPIPQTLSRLDASAFEGNTKKLCGDPLDPCVSLSIATIILVWILVATASVAVVAIIVILLCRRQQPASVHPADLGRMEQGQVVASSSLPKIRHGRKKSEPNVKITFLRNDRDEFDMTDLLKAAAEILGSAVFGSTYKAAVSDGHVVVVKRFRQMNHVDKEDFHEHMRRLGKLNHPSVLPIVGFYYRKEEKLLVADYVERGSLASHLHGNNRSRNHQCLDWPTRLSILKGVARGLLYLYNELPSLMAPHGHLKSSNVLLNNCYTPILTDYGLVPVVNQEHAQAHMIAYKSPEYKRSGRITKKTDVWSLGILIVETLTGRFPSNFLHQGKSSDVDATLWVESVVSDEEKDVDVFDTDMARDKNAEGEMTKLLKIGFECCQADVDMRPDIMEAVEKIEEIQRGS